MKYSYLPVTTQALYSEGGCRENAAKHHLVPYMSRDMVAYMFLNMVACMSLNLVAYMSLNMVAYMPPNMVDYISRQGPPWLLTCPPTLKNGCLHVPTWSFTCSPP